MASPFADAVAPVWQDPLVEVLKLGMTHRNIGWHIQGDVEQMQDRLINKNVFRIRGAIAATNYLRVPRDAAKGTQGLGLTGRYVYLELRRVRELPLTVHIDFVTSKKTVLRFTLSTIYQALRSTGTVLRVPLNLDARWSVVVVDMMGLLERHSFNQYSRDSYRHIKAITLCASMNVRNLVVSPRLYTPESLPSVLRLPGTFGDQYNWQTLPVGLHLSDNNEKRRCTTDPVKQEALRIASTPQRGSNTRRNSVENKHAVQEEAVVEPGPPACEIRMKASPGTRDSNLRRDRNNILAKADQILRDAGIFELQTEEPSNQSLVDAEARLSGASVVARSTVPASKRRQQTKITSTCTREQWPDPILELQRVIGFSNDFPGMLLWLPDGATCVYSSFSTIVLREFYDGDAEATQESEGSTAAAKGSAGTVGSPTSTREYFLHGHSAAICALALSNDGKLLASTETPTESASGGIRLWDLLSHECLTVVKAQSKGVHALCFSPQGKNRSLLCAVGHDECFRTQIFVWDCSSLVESPGTRASRSRGGPVVNLLARQTSDFPVTRVAFSPYEQHDSYYLVSCGRENIRYWRVNPSSGHLTGCPVILNEYSRGTVFTNVGFDTLFESFPSNIHRVRPLYVTSSLGTLLVVDYDSREVLCVYQLHDAAINCLSVNEGFCVTGSDDCFLRVWPLDFTDFFLEAQHEAGVNCVDVSPDGMKVLVGSRNSAIGVLDISDQRYVTALRSHTQEVVAMAPAPWRSPLSSFLVPDESTDDNASERSELITISSDGTLRVWDAPSGQQLYEFDMQQDRATSVAVSPTVNGIVAVGFASGCTRIFDVHRTSTELAVSANTDKTHGQGSSSVLREFQQHQSAIRHLAFDADAQYLYTSGAGKQLCLYDARGQDYTPLKMLLTDFDRLDGRFALSRDKKWLGMVSGDHQGVVLVDPCSLRVISTVRPPKPLNNSQNTQEEALRLVQFSSNATELLAVSTSDRLHIFSLETRAFVQSMPLIGQHGITALVTSANAKYMATGGADGSLRVWQWGVKGRIGRMHQAFVGHAGKVSALAFTKDGKHLVATGESSAICVWQFHGDRTPGSPCSLVHPTTGDPGLQTRQSEARTATSVRQDTQERDADMSLRGMKDVTGASTGTLKPPLHGIRSAIGPEMSPSLHVPMPSSKPKFSLSLEMDALALDGSGNTSRIGAPPSSVSSDASLRDLHHDESTSAVVVSAADDVQGCLELSGTIGGLSPLLVAWSYSTGKLLYARNAVLVMEDLASGCQAFHVDHDDAEEVVESSNDATFTQNPATEIVLMSLSPSGESVATISSRFDFVSIRKIKRVEETSETDAVKREDQSVIALLPGTQVVTVLEFGHSSHRPQRDEITGELLCMACDMGSPHQQQHHHVVVVASTTTSSIVWSSAHCRRWQAPAIRQIVATSASNFLLFSADQSSVDTLVVHSASAGSSLDRNVPGVEVRSTIEAFPSSVKLVSLLKEGENHLGHLRYLVGVDNDRYCYFFDLQRQVFLATSQLLPQSTKKSSNQTEKTRTANSSDRPIEFMEWLTPTEKPLQSQSLLVTGSSVDSVLYVHTLPMMSTKHSQPRSQVDWQSVGRGGVSLAFTVALDGGDLRSLSVDPVRGSGVATTKYGSISLVNLHTSTATKTLKKSSSISSGEMKTFQVSHASSALEGAVLLSTSPGDGDLRVWVLELAREVASFHVASASCTCFAVNPFAWPFGGMAHSMVLAGYSDGSLRVFDLRDMRLMAQFELAPASLQIARYGGGSFVRIVFVGAVAALVVTSEHRVLIVDLSNGLEPPENAVSAHVDRERPSVARVGGTNRKKPQPQPHSKTKPSARGRGGRHEIVYRELSLLPSSNSRKKRVCSRVGAETDAQLRVEVGAIDVLQDSRSRDSLDGANVVIHPFLIVVGYAGRATKNLGAECAVKVFESRPLATLDSDELTPMDEWSLGPRTELHEAVAAFTPSSSREEPRVLYPYRLLHDSSIQSLGQATDKWWWGLAVRDCTPQRESQRLAFATSSFFLEYPVALKRHQVAESAASKVEEMVLLVDRAGRMAVLDCTRLRLIPIDTRLARASGLKLQPGAGTRDRGSRLILFSSSQASKRDGVDQLAVGTLHFESV